MKPRLVTVQTGAKVRVAESILNFIRNEEGKGEVGFGKG